MEVSGRKIAYTRGLASFAVLDAACFTGSYGLAKTLWLAYHDEVHRSFELRKEPYCNLDFIPNTSKL
jgi:hypothetical protein